MWTLSVVVLGLQLVALRTTAARKGLQSTEDVVLELDSPQCGAAFGVSLTHSGRKRTADIYVPNSVCESQASGKVLAMPLIAALHCFGCSNRYELSKWKAAAERHSLAIVAPMGGDSNPCWNAVDCCGDCVTRGDDDTGFIAALLLALVHSSTSDHSDAIGSKQFFAIFSGAKRRLSAEALFVTGFSNGGYLTDYLAWLSATGSLAIRFVAAAPVSGYIYDSDSLVRSAESKSMPNKVAVLLHIGTADEKVRANGCCNSEGHNCCCGIGQALDSCVSITAEYSHWLEYYAAIAENPNDFAVNRSLEFDIDKAHCTLHESGIAGVCLHKDAKHEFSHSLPLLEETVTFFLKHLCLKHGGVFKFDSAETADNEWLSAAPFTCDCAPKTDGNWCNASPLKPVRTKTKSRDPFAAKLKRAQRMKKKRNAKSSWQNLGEIVDAIESGAEDAVNAQSVRSRKVQLGIVDDSLTADTGYYSVSWLPIFSVLAVVFALYFVRNCDYLLVRKL